MEYHKSIIKHIAIKNIKIGVDNNHNVMYYKHVNNTLQ